MTAKFKNHGLTFRVLSLLLVFIQIFGGFPSYVWASGESKFAGQAKAEGPTTQKSVEVARIAGELPARRRVSIEPKFSSEPTDDEISRAPVFSQPLVLVGISYPQENKELGAALMAYAKRSKAEDQSVLLEFLADHPQSAWKPALLVNLGIAWRQTGFFSKAMSAWEEAWNLTKRGADIKVRALADRALGEFMQMNAWVGRYEVLEPLFAEIGNRQLIGGATEMIAGARQGLSIMKTSPDKGFLCGPYALRKILLSTDPKADTARLEEAKSTINGFSLTQVQELAQKCGLNYQMAKRDPGSAIPLKSVVHWKLNHFGALLKEESDRYLIQDSTFSHFYGHELWITKEALEEESDGYFLIPAGPLPKGWRAVGADEGNKVWGRGQTTDQNPKAFTPKDKKTCPDKQGRGMAQYSAHLMLVSLNIVDTPLGYTPPVGPEVNFTATYNQRDSSADLAPLYSNLGSKWTFDWFSYVVDQGANGVRTTVTRYERGGGVSTHRAYNSSTGFYDKDRDGEVLQYIAGPGNDYYQLTYPDGSVEIFDQPSTTSPGSRKLFLTDIKDPAGQTVHLDYDTQGRLFRVVDALGQITTLYYDLGADIHKITRVEDPFHRIAYFEYNANGYLSKITDVIGMSSAFGYGPGDFISTMATPYGVSRFSFGYAGTTRWLVMTDPNGDSEQVYFQHEQPSRGVPSQETEFPQNVPGINNSYLEFRNTFYFDKKVMKDYGPSAFDKATIYHWLHDDDDGALLTSEILESEKSPLESRIYYGYAGQQRPMYSLGIASRKPSVIARVVDDSEHPGMHIPQSWEVDYNAQGNVTRIKDPKGRQTSVDYYPNGIDLWKARQTTGTMNELLCEFGAYNSAHRPSSFTDASRRTNSLFWNGAGQLTNIINPKLEATFIDYLPSGYFQRVRDIWSGGTKITSATFDSYGRLGTVTDSEGYTLSCDYDALDRLTKITYPDTSFEKFDYVRLDLVRVWDRTGRRTQITYDAVGRPLTVKDRLGRLTQFSWCGCGGLESITDPLQHVTSWVRDLQGRITEKHFADTKIVQYAYEQRTSRLKTVTDSKNQVKHYSYDNDGTLTNISYTVAVIPTASVGFTYDPNYRRLLGVKVTRPDASTEQTTYAYNPVTTSQSLGAGRLASVDGPLANDTIVYSYDELGRVTGTTINGVGESVQFDTLGRVQSHTTPLGTFTPTYLNATRRLTSFAYPNGQTTTFDYFDNLGDRRLKQIWHKTSTQTTISKFDYQYDVLGRITNWVQQAGADTPRNYSLEYDAEDQFVRSVASGGPPSFAFTYGYDAAGNRTSEQRENSGTMGAVSVNSFANNTVNQLTGRTGPETPTSPLPVRFKGTVNEPATVTVEGQAAAVANDPSSPPAGRIFSATVDLNNNPNNLVQVGATDFGANGGNTSTKNFTMVVNGQGNPQSFGYDDNGNRVSVTSGSSITTYEWDAEDRLVAINSAPLRTEFTYDGFGRRIQIVEKNNGNITRTKKFVWCRSRIREERDAGNTVTKRFYSEGEQIAGAKYYFTRDHLGSVREMTDESGILRARYDYGLYGLRSANLITSNPVEADFGFTGHYFHAQSGLHLTWFRAYDAEAGRWLSRDPIGEAGGINLFGYVGNDPINGFDPFGLIDANELAKMMEVIVKLTREIDAELAAQKALEKSIEKAEEVLSDPEIELADYDQVEGFQEQWKDNLTKSKGRCDQRMSELLQRKIDYQKALEEFEQEEAAKRNKWYRKAWRGVKYVGEGLLQGLIILGSRGMVILPGQAPTDPSRDPQA